jgi:Flp pilus assembly pilin Flp
LLGRRGLETVEYAIMAGLIVAACVGAHRGVGAWVKNTYSTFQKELK